MQYWICFNADMLIYINFCFAQSGHRMSSPSVMNPLPTKEALQLTQMKQSLCQCLSSNDMNLVPPMPAFKHKQTYEDRKK